MHLHLIFLKQGATGPAGPPGPRGLPGNVVCMRWCICFPICALISLFNTFRFPSHGVFYKVQKAVFHYTSLWLNWKMWWHLGMVFPLNIFSYSFVTRGRHGAASLLIKLSKTFFAASSSREKIAMFIVWLVLFPLPHFHLSFPFENLTSWYKDCIVSSYSVLRKHVSIRSYNQSLEVSTASSLPQYMLITIIKLCMIELFLSA